MHEGVHHLLRLDARVQGEVEVEGELALRVAECRQQCQRHQLPLPVVQSAPAVEVAEDELGDIAAHVGGHVGQRGEDRVTRVAEFEQLGVTALEAGVAALLFTDVADLGGHTAGSAWRAVKSSSRCQASALMSFHSGEPPSKKECGAPS